uniref:Uncharacterized protein n=1 Tax=Photinus pyralis TaxID=7054 RepID=A0A1Y1LXQ9_PHOPY
MLKITIRYINYQIQISQNRILIMVTFLHGVFIILAFSQVRSVEEHFYTKEDRICMERFGVDKAYVDSHITPPFTVNKGDAKFDEFVMCWAGETKLVDDSLKLSYSGWEDFSTDYMLQFITKPDSPHRQNRKELAKKLVNECGSKAVGNSPADSVLLMVNCLFAEFIELGKE